MMTTSDPRETASAVPNPPLNGSTPWLPAPSPMPLEDWAALLGAVSTRLQQLVDGGGAAALAGTVAPCPLQDCVDALRLLQLRLQDSLQGVSPTGAEPWAERPRWAGLRPVRAQPQAAACAAAQDGRDGPGGP